jgi:hypothetical protein
MTSLFSLLYSQGKNQIEIAEILLVLLQSHYFLMLTATFIGAGESLLPNGKSHI